MSYAARIILDSISPGDVRLTTFELVYPRIIHQEMLRHRVHSRSVASSRAIPVIKQMEKILADPYIPDHWKANQKGMVPGDELNTEDSAECTQVWLEALHSAHAATKKLVALNVHKEQANRLMECFSWTRELVTATEWDNFFQLRQDSNAQEQIQIIANLMRESLANSTPKRLKIHEWHLPMIREDDANFSLAERKDISAGRCARLSYETHYGIRDPKADISLGHDLATEWHFSPFEHQATPFETPHRWSNNFRGWIQNRADVERRARIDHPKNLK